MLGRLPLVSVGEDLRDVSLWDGPMNLWIQILFGTLAVAPTLLVLAVLIASILRARRKSRVPVKDKLLRAPGETLQRRLNRFDDNTIPYLFGLLAFGFLCFAQI